VLALPATVTVFPDIPSQPMVAAMARHLRSLRSMERDHGWIHTLLEEAENERMHLVVVTLAERKPGVLMRAMVLLGQGVFFNLYFALYLLAPRTCHRFVGFLEEEAVKTYTKAINDLDAGKLPEWVNKPANDVAIKYWRLPKDAKIRDMLMAMRADEALHRDTNHVFSTLPPNIPNPFK
jgi:threonyl-tRNA synthetase